MTSISKFSCEQHSFSSPVKPPSSRSELRCQRCGLRHPQRGRESSELQTDSSAFLQRDGAATFSCPARFPQYASFQERVSSFKGWPEKVVGQSPHTMSAAGFFYIGSADRVQCFFCGQRLRNWEKEDDPKKEHREHCPKCLFAEQSLEPGFTCIGQDQPSQEMSEAKLTDQEALLQHNANHPGDTASTTPTDSLNQSPSSVPQTGNSAIQSPSSVPQAGNSVSQPSNSVSQPSNSVSQATTSLLSQGSSGYFSQGNLSLESNPLQPSLESRGVGAGIDYDKYGIMMEAVRLFDIPEAIIKRAIHQRHADGGPDFKNASELFEVAEKLHNAVNSSTAAVSMEMSGSTSLPPMNQSPRLPLEPSSASLPYSLNTPSSSGGPSPASDLPSSNLSSSNPSAPSQQPPLRSPPPSLRPTSALEENRRLRRDFLCRMCHAKPCDTTFLPCGHYVTCRDCASRTPTCCVCHRQVLGTIKTYLA